MICPRKEGIEGRNLVITEGALKVIGPERAAISHRWQFLKATNNGNLLLYFLASVRLIKANNHCAAASRSNFFRIFFFLWSMEHVLYRIPDSVQLSRIYIQVLQRRVNILFFLTLFWELVLLFGFIYTILRNLFTRIDRINIFFNNIDLTGICQAKKKKIKPQQWTFPLPVATSLM